MPNDLIDQLAAMPKRLAHLVVEVADEALDEAAPDAWSARTILAHFRDDEYLCMRVALERMLAEENPLLHFLDGATWEPGRNRTRDRREVITSDFALQRQASIGILNGLRPEDWSRTGRTEDGRTFTVEQFVAAWAGHDAEHQAQLERVLGVTYADVFKRRMRRE